MKEGIYFGPDPGSDDTDAAAWEPMMGPNQFPDEKQLPGFAATIKSYMDKMSLVGYATPLSFFFLLFLIRKKRE